MNVGNETEVQKHLPGDLLPKVTIFLQDSGYVTISPIELTGFDWRRFNEKVRQMGGLWILDGARTLEHSLVPIKRASAKWLF